MKDKDSYIFTSDRKPNQKLRRETITMDVNKVTHSVSKLLPAKPNITSHSFRIGYISQLWKDPKTKVITVFRKQGNGKLSRFTTTYKLSLREREHLYNSGGNFVTEVNLKQQNELPIQNNFHEEKGTNNDL